MQTNNYRASCDRLSLAVYREVAAHLRQLDGVSTDLVDRTATSFNYYDSQIEAMLLHFAPNVPETSRQR